MDDVKNVYVYEIEVRGRKIRVLSIAGMNLVRHELGLPLIRPHTWRDLGQDEKKKIIHETRTGATPAMLERFFGEDLEWNDAITK